MTHPLDRPIWTALTGPQAAFAQGSAAAWRLDPAMGYFAATADPADTGALAPLLAADGRLILFENEVVAPWSGVSAEAGLMVQMVAEVLDPPGLGPAIEPLGAEDAPAMLALATATRPGPFLAGTPRFGGFLGIRERGALVAMAGTRLRVPGFVEVSGVCTDPAHRGRGHAARLIRAVAAVIVAGGDRPFLHTFAANTGARALYHKLGYDLRRELMMTSLSSER